MSKMDYIKPYIDAGLMVPNPLLKEGITKEQIDELFKEYMEIYGKYIPDWLQELMEEDKYIGLYDIGAPSDLIQFYDEYNLIKDHRNIYNGFVQIIKDQYPDLSNKTILDVAGGTIPTLGRKLAKEAKNVIVIDEKIAHNNNPNNLETIQKKIESTKDLPMADLIIGFMPCEATKFIPKHAANTNTDFIVELCGCIHNEKLRNLLAFNPYAHDSAFKQYNESLTNYFKNRVQEGNLGELTEFTTSINMPFKVLGNKRVR